MQRYQSSVFLLSKANRQRSFLTASLLVWFSCEQDLQRGTGPLRESLLADARWGELSFLMDPQTEAFTDRDVEGKAFPPFPLALMYLVFGPLNAYDPILTRAA